MHMKRRNWPVIGFFSALALRDAELIPAGTVYKFVCRRLAALSGQYFGNWSASNYKSRCLSVDVAPRPGYLSFPVEMATEMWKMFAFQRRNLFGEHSTVVASRWFWWTAVYVPVFNRLHSFQTYIYLQWMGLDEITKRGRGTFDVC